MVIIMDHQQKEEEYRKNVELMRAKLVQMQTKTVTTTEIMSSTTSQTEIIDTLKSSIMQQETLLTSETTVRESVEK